MYPITKILCQNEQLRLSIEPSRLLLRAGGGMEVLSSALLGGGFLHTDTIVNRHVKKGYNPRNPEMETQEWLEERGYDPRRTVTLLTAAWVERAEVVEKVWDHVRLAAIVTAGVSNAARAGKQEPVDGAGTPDPGTINTILLIDGRTTPGAMVNAVITATEAKTAALADLEVRDADGALATGTTTDAVVVAATQRGNEGEVLPYAGVASPLGRAVGTAVYQAVYRVIRRLDPRERTGRRW
ncbi:adenosylcobinamide amidohydrolase [Paludifilum halophilum]|uniref:Adenosylcobinamide amidohydrolase n=1 Tax=Paludifilum halophilum TaxID=1642702 RepID=A0A235B1R1_9BACL|nr:adenosylcobinamide amidohydrolase [Paludifilum halophilum]OYD06182.1 hypothetical protein CHM34_17710 [Paludifilum halophilum]